MDIEMKPYVVYIKTDAEGRITGINSSEFLTDTDGWLKIDQGFGDKYRHAQGNYLPGPLTDDRGVYCYKLEDGTPVERTQEEMDADAPKAEEQPSPALETRVEQVESKTAELEESLEMLLSGVTADE